MLFLTLLYVHIRDNPIADSVAANDKINNTHKKPTISSNCMEKIIKFKLTANNIISMDINTINKLFRFKTIPEIPVKNNKVVKETISCKFIF